MSWRDEMRPASFRGVRFHVREGERTGGRVQAIHKFPFSEKPPYTQDMGAEGRTFTLECIVIGDDYREQLKTLLDALDQEGTGQLDHPYLGIRTVAVGTYRVRQTTNEGGMASVSVPFTESSTEPAAPAPTIDASAAVTATASRVKASTAAAFSSSAVGITDVGAPAFGAVNGLVSGFSSKMSAVLAGAAVPGGALAGVRRLIALPSVTARQFSNAVDYFPALVDSLVTAAAAALVDAASLVPDPIGVLLSLVDGVTLPDDASEEAIANFPAVRVLLERTVLVAVSTSVLTRTFPSFEDALAMRQTVVSAINAHTATSVDDTYSDFVDLRVALAAAVPGEASSLPRLQRYTPPTTVPSLVLAHRLFGSVANELAIVERNKIRHPAFVPGGRSIEVLTRE